MKIDIELLTVVDGQPKEIELFGEKYALTKIVKKTPEEKLYIPPLPYVEPKRKSSKKLQPKQLDRGKEIDKVNHTKIFENIYNEVKPFVEKGQDTTKNLVRVIGKYYPDSILSSKKSVASVYRSYVRRQLSGKSYSVSGTISEYKYDKGQKKGVINGVTIFENVLKEILNAIHENQSRGVLKRIMKKHHPNVTKKSIEKYVSVYLKYIDNNGGSVDKYYKKRTEPGRKILKRKRQPEDAVGFSKKYKTWIKKDEESLVKRGIMTVEYNYYPSVENITKKAGLKPDRVRAVLSYLMQIGEVKRTFDGDRYTYVYELVD